jgi:hypothetical protein
VLAAPSGVPTARSPGDKPQPPGVLPGLLSAEVQNLHELLVHRAA